ncbi:hypothetical protein SK128_027334, partial [Halocaridina rubra]
SEAVDLSLQLSRLYTCGTDAVVIDNAFHGNVDSVYPLSPKVSKACHSIQSLSNYTQRHPQPPEIHPFESYLSSEDILPGLAPMGGSMSPFLAIRRGWRTPKMMPG